MDDEHIPLQRLEEIEFELKSLGLQMSTPCNCNSHLEIRLREIAGRNHYVRQCKNCGEQRGTPLKPASAKIELEGRTPNHFDYSIQEARQQRNQRWGELIDEKKQIQIELGEVSEESLALFAKQEKIAKAGEEFAQQVRSLSDEIGIQQAIKCLIEQTVQLKRKIHSSLCEDTQCFESETELQAWFVEHLSPYFDIHHEVEGVHLAENKPVRIDYILQPKIKLIEAGFDESPFGVEVKCISRLSRFTHKTSRALWQTISYNDCEFELDDGKKVKPKYSLLFSNLSFDDEAKLIKCFGHEYENDKFEWAGMLHLANHAKVGTLGIKGTRSEYRGWRMEFAGGTYFSCSIYGGTSQFGRPNNSIIDKVRIGNF